MQNFIINTNEHLKHNTLAFHHTDYLGYGKAGNPNYINDLKNLFHNNSRYKLNNAMSTVSDILKEDLPMLYQVFKESNENNNLVACMIPRSKTNERFSQKQLLLKEAVRTAVKSNRLFADGLNYITRTTNTCTTHMSNSQSTSYHNDGSMPYVGITIDTCQFSPYIRGKNILLIDDVYTNNVNIAEDAIEALYKKGAKNVVFYALAKTLDRRYR